MQSAVGRFLTNATLLFARLSAEPGCRLFYCTDNVTLVLCCSVYPLEPVAVPVTVMV
jgi:hypothetical protein